MTPYFGLSDATRKILVLTLVRNKMRFGILKRSRGVFTYGDVDKIVQAVQQNGQFIRCHTLVWYAQVPSWVTKGNFNNTTLISIMKPHIANVVGHFKGKCTR